MKTNDSSSLIFCTFQGAGSALMGRMAKFEQIVRGMNYVSKNLVPLVSCVDLVVKHKICHFNV